MTDDTALLRQALDALECEMLQTRPIDKTREAIDALRARLDGAPQPHPMLCATHYCKDCAALWRQCDDLTFSLRSQACCTACNNAPVGGQLFALTTPVAQPARVPMTECEASHLIAKAFESAKDVDSKSLSREIARAVERHHGIRSEE